MRRWLAVLCAAWLATMAQADGGAVLIRDVRVFDGERMQRAQDVLVTDGRIARMATSIKAPDGIQTIDGRGKTLLPGLIDSHVHAFPSAPEDALRFGVTAEFDMFALLDPATVAQRRAQRESYGRTDAADIWSAGRGVTLPGAHPTGMAKGFGVDLETLDEDGDAAAFVKREVAEGSDYIKIFQDASVRDGKPRFPEYGRDQLGRIIAAAHANGRKAIVHVSTEEDARDVFLLGGDASAHMFEDQPASPAVVQLAKEKKATIIATLSVLATIAGDGAAGRLMADAAIKPALSAMQTGMLSAGVSKTRPEVLAHALESVGRFHRAGVVVLAGTDAPNPGTAHGPSIHEELELLVRAGMTPAAALAAATSRAADFFDVPDRGRVAVGKRADLLLVDGDPTADITATRRIARIWKNGFSVDREKLPAPPAPPPAR